MSRASGLEYGLDFLRACRGLIPEFPCRKNSITDIKIALINSEKLIHLLSADFNSRG